MFVKNADVCSLNLKIGEVFLFIMPNDIVFVAEENVPSVQHLIDNGTLAIVDEDEGKEHEQKRMEEAKVKAEESVVPVVKVHDSKKQSTTVVDCAAITKSGKKCSGSVIIPFDEYDADKPYFCGRHKSEDAANYERINGEWVRKLGK